ncbi:hypothetical protein GCM10010349_40730 [Streptomyces flavofungini]|nr:hypothetical protein GCM10010349_40730 [Streptomyces flavofungini]
MAAAAAREGTANARTATTAESRDAARRADRVRYGTRGLLVESVPGRRLGVMCGRPVGGGWYVRGWFVRRWYVDRFEVGEWWARGAPTASTCGGID